MSNFLVFEIFTPMKILMHQFNILFESTFIITGLIDTIFYHCQAKVRDWSPGVHQGVRAKHQRLFVRCESFFCVLHR